MKIIKNNRLDEKVTYSMIMKLLNKNEIILEIIHLANNHCCRYIYSTLFTILSGMES